MTVPISLYQHQLVKRREVCQLPNFHKAIKIGNSLETVEVTKLGNNTSFGFTIKRVLPVVTFLFATIVTLVALKEGGHFGKKFKAASPKDYKVLMKLTASLAGGLVVGIPLMISSFYETCTGYILSLEVNDKGTYLVTQWGRRIDRVIKVTVELEKGIYKLKPVLIKDADKKADEMDMPHVIMGTGNCLCSTPSNLLYWQAYHKVNDQQRTFMGEIGYVIQKGFKMGPSNGRYFEVKDLSGVKCSEEKLKKGVYVLEALDIIFL